MISEPKGELNSPLPATRMPSLVALRCFEAAARFENFARAADELHLTPGAVSRAVRVLEEDLGIALFERRNRKVYLTEAGRNLADAVSNGFAMISRSVSQLRAGTRQRVLSCEPTLLMRWLIPRWGEFEARFGKHEIHLVAASGAFSFNQGIDFAIRRNDFPEAPTCHVEHLFMEKVGPVCRPDRVAAWFDEGSSLKQEAPLLVSRSRSNAWQAWSAARGIAEPTNVLQCFEHFYFSLQAAVAGIGVAIGPWQLVKDDLQSGLLAAPLDFVEDGTQYCLFSPEVAKAGSVERDLTDWLHDIS